MNILICANISQSLYNKLTEFCSIECWVGPRTEVPFQAANRNEVIIIRTPYRLSPDIASNASNLKMVIRAGSGTDGLYSDTFKRRGVKVHILPLASPSVAEHAFALMLSAARAVPYMDRTTKAGQWKKSEAKGIELFGKSLHIVGFGNVGRHIATIATGFGLKILISDPSMHKSEKQTALSGLPNAQIVSMEKGITSADIIVLACPAKPETFHLIDRVTLSHIKPGAIIVNVGRAELIDNKALTESLNNGRLISAGLDVHYNEPNLDLQQLQCDKIIATPHIGAQTIDARDRIENNILELIKHHKECGKKP